MTDRYTTKDLLNLTEAKAQQIFAKGREATVWALLELSALAKAANVAAKGASDEPDPSTPSAMVAPFKKPNTSKSRKAKKPGRKQGHMVERSFDSSGEHRAAPEQIDRREAHRLERCPDCGGPVSPTKASPRRRVIEDIEQTRSTATEHSIYSHYCPHCKKRVEPKVTQALPQATIGNRTVALTGEQARLPVGFTMAWATPPARLSKSSIRSFTFPSAPAG
jgi:uncharacterized protein with PIN domain